jgi:hypothetical protein
MKILRAFLVVMALSALVGHQACARGEDPSPARDLQAHIAHQGGFLAQVFATEPEQEQEFVENLVECALPVWNELRDAGVLASVDLFALSEEEGRTFAVSPPWRYLMIAQLEPDASVVDFSSAERAATCLGVSDVASHVVVREEHLACTRNSCFGAPQLTYPDAPTGIDYLIEFIAVENTSTSLTKYHDLMADFIGPANGILVERGMLHCFVALETTANEIGEHEVVPWNQLHISDHWDEGGDLDWDAVYEDLFREEFSRELDDVWSELPPTRDSSTEYRGRLVLDLCVR